MNPQATIIMPVSARKHFDEVIRRPTCAFGPKPADHADRAREELD
jgi:hypothetical protein